MACPTCSHTMQNLGIQGKVFWCPRCGTIKTEYSTLRDEVERPMLVERCNEFLLTLAAEAWHKQDAKRIGLTDCLSPEVER